MDPVRARFLKLGLVAWGLAALVIALVMTGVLSTADSAAMTGLRAATDPLPDWTDAAMRGASWLGDGWPRSLLALGFVGYLVSRKLYRAVSYIVYTALGIAALNAWVLKALFHRPRPELVERLVDVDASWSLPSGHAANSAAVYGAIALIATVLWWRKAQRRTIWAVTGLLVFLIGLSRIWLGVHWPSDVVAGWLVGAGWALLLAVALKPVQARFPSA
ncbi:phosphatase PAP2 family protein [Sphingomonas sp. LaA6.9]|uniref:phosphatase PAP2 family protein n=1 Tax=Sphingomonas sp. LaA6.9 TaxID=2919914 RepID=UPI001F4F62E0|nr:phosphatase PAP2 family protein [Sphingomonas sp. LaA6.9]MCJ8159442.1 phosphatase PAP2 family protein [Sphingomonas sp. LaA6.9]